MAKRACSPAPSNGARRLLWVTLPIILRGVSRSTVLTQMAAALHSFPSRPVLSRPIPSHPVQSHPILSHPILRGRGVLRSGPKQVSSLGCAICKQRCSAGEALGVSEEEMLYLPQAVTLQDLLPEVTQQLQDANSSVGVKFTTVLHNMLHLADRQKAVPIALQLPELLLPFFLNVSPAGEREAWLIWLRGV